MVHLYLLRDPVTGRVSAQTREWDDSDRPPLRRNQRRQHSPGMRELDVPQSTWTAMMRGRYTPDAQDTIHLRWWDEAGER